jgi:hypothetical protein
MYSYNYTDCIFKINHFSVPPSDLLLRLGEHDLSVEEEPYGYEERRIQIVASHPQFDPRTFEYDLALLRFYEPVKFQPNIIPVCVPEDDSNFVGSSAYVTGWGRLYEGKHLKNNIPITKNQRFSIANKFINNIHLSIFYCI